MINQFAESRWRQMRLWHDSMKAMSRHEESGPLSVLIVNANPTSQIMTGRLCERMRTRGLSARVMTKAADGSWHCADSPSDWRLLLGLANSAERFRGNAVKAFFKTVSCYRQLLRQQDPKFIDAVLLYDDGAIFNRAVAEWGRKQDLPVFLVPESGGAAVGSVPSRYWSTRQRIMRRLVGLSGARFAPSNAEGIASSYLCAPNAYFSRVQRKVMKRRQIHAITGSPLYDGAVAKPLRPVGSNKSVLFIHQWGLFGYPLYENYIRSLAKAAAHTLNLSLTIKAHPRSPPEDMARLEIIAELYKEGGRVKLDNISDSEKIVGDHDVAVSAFSATVNRAVLEGVPVVLLEGLSDRETKVSLVEFGGAVAVNQPAALSDAVMELVYDEKSRIAWHERVRRRVIPEMFLGLDGKAADRIVQFITSTVSHSP